MVGKNLKLAFIENNAARKACLRKRKMGLMKNIEALSILCGVDAAAVMYGSDDEIEAWPPSQTDAQKIVSKFRNLPGFSRAHHMMNLNEFTAKQVEKLQEKLENAEQERKRKETENFIFQCLEGAASMENLTKDDIKDVEDNSQPNQGE